MVISITEAELPGLTPKDYRMLMREGGWSGSSTVACRGYAQASVTFVPRDLAFDYLLFCNRNPRPCPVIEVAEVGNPHPPTVAPEADLRTDLGKYRVYENGKLVAEPRDINRYWRDDLVAFILGCGHSFDWALRAANVKFRNTGAYLTNIRCNKAGPLSGRMVVSCRVVKGSSEAVRAVQITSRFTATHGPPVHIGDPTAIGIKDLNERLTPCRPREYIPPMESDEIALFWGCAVTPEAVAIESKVPLMIVNHPGNELVTDKSTEELAVK